MSEQQGPDEDSTAGDEVDRISEWTRPNAAQKLIAVIIVFAAAAMFYKKLHDHDLQQTGALYIGLPMFLAVALVLAPRAESTFGIAVKGTAIALLLSVPVVGEGFICVLMVSPLFFLVAVCVAAVIKASRKNTMNSILFLPLLLMSMEGVTPITTFDESIHTSATQTVPGTPEHVAQALTQPMNFDTNNLPLYLKMGFPKPIDATGSPLEIGATRRVTFAGAPKRPSLQHQHHWGTNPTTMELSIVETSSNRVVFDVISDHTPSASWVDLHRAYVEWHAVDATHTSITWAFDFDRRLAPAWYFGPWERYGTQKAAEYLIKSLPVGAPSAAAMSPAMHEHHG